MKIYKLEISHRPWHQEKKEEKRIKSVYLDGGNKEVLIKAPLKMQKLVVSSHILLANYLNALPH